MAPRPELHAILKDLLGSGNVYFQPPPTVMMKYPCIIYNRDDIDIRHANDKPYKHTKRYQITHIDANPDSTVPDEIAMLPMCSFDRWFTADNLNHNVFNIFF